MKTKQTMVYGARILLCVFAVMFALAFTACDNPLDGPSGPPGGPPPIPLNGTWSSPDGEKIVLNNGSVTVSQNDVEFAKGTYITIGSTIAMTFTQFKGSFLTTSGLDMLTLSPTEWYTQPQLKAAIIGYYVGLGYSTVQAETYYYQAVAPEVNAVYATFTGTYSGNTLSITIFGETATYTNPGIGIGIGPGTGTEADPIALTAGVWASGSVPLGSSVVWYSFYVTGGTRYYIWWNDEDDGDGTKTGDVVVSAYYSSGIALLTEEDSGWSTPEYFTPITSGTVKIKVVPYGGSYPTGTFAIAYSTSNTRPSPGIGPGTGGPSNWITVSNSTIPNVAIAYGNGLFVAVGNFGRMAYSSNGVSWTDIDSPFGSTSSDDIKTIAYGDGKFVAGDLMGNIAYSSNGIDWTAVASNPWLNTELNAYVSIRAIAYGNGKFVAVGAWGKIAYSSDGGETWTEVLDSTFGGYDEIHSVAFGGGRFVAGGLDKEYEASDYYGDNCRMASSSDGISWTKVPNFRMYSILDIAYGNGVFVAGGATSMAYSTNGTSWTAVPGPACYAIAYGNNRFVAVGELGTIEYSSDGITWTAVANSPLSDLIYAIAYGGGRFVALGYGPSIAYCDW
jgi:photosystem II stability/assembly factor-like uncharacterized protein